MKTNVYVRSRKHTILLIYRRQLKTSYSFLVDNKDVAVLSKYQWSITHSHNKLNVYALNTKVGKLHQFLLGRSKGKVIDHINGNTLDNRRSNLRHISYSGNCINRTGVSGIYFANDRKQWRALIEVDKKKIHLGSFDKKEDALKARQEAEAKYFGEYVRKKDLSDNNKS